MKTIWMKIIENNKKLKKLSHALPDLIQCEWRSNYVVSVPHNEHNVYIEV